MSQARAERAAVQGLVHAQREYDEALRELREARRLAAEARQGEQLGALDERARLLEASRAAALRAAASFDVAFATLEASQRELERSLDLLRAAKLAAAREHLPGPGALAIERAERIVADGRARLVEAGRVLRDARAVSDPSA